MALVASQLGTASWASTGAKSVTFSAPTAGDVLAVIMSATDPACDFTSITSGWTAGPSSPISTGNLRAVTYWKVSDGTETSFGFTVSTTVGQAFAVRVTGFTGTATLEGTPDEDETKLSTVSTTVGSGSRSNSTASAVAIALFASDRVDSVQDVSRSYSNSFTEVGFNGTSGSRSGAFAAAKILSSAASQSTTFTTGDTGDEMYGAILVFGDVTGGGSISGDAAITEDDDTAAAAGTVDVAGAAALSEDADTVSATGTIAVDGAADVAEADDAASAAGTVDVSGAASITEADDTLASDGTVAAGGGVSGDAAITEGDDTAAASGTVAVAGAATVVEGDDALSATAGIGVGGAASISEQDDTLAATGTSGAGATESTGAADISEAPDTVAASGIVEDAVVPQEDPFWLYRDQGRALNEDSFPHTGRSSDMMKLFHRFRRRA